MNCKKITEQVYACSPKYQGRMNFNISELARIFTGGNREVMRELLIRYSVPPYLGDISATGSRSGRKRYNLFDVYEAIEKTKWKIPTIN